MTLVASPKMEIITVSIYFIDIITQLSELNDLVFAKCLEECLGL